MNWEVDQITGGMDGDIVLVLMSLDRWRVGGPIYVIGMIDRWAWLAHGPQMCCYLPLLHCSVAVMGDSVSC